MHDLPGMTRDRSYGLVEILDAEAKVTEIFECVDTGGLDFEGSDVITQGITRMADQALEEAQVICFLVDGHDGCTSADEEIALRLQRTGKPVLLVINKVDGMKGGAPDGAFYRFGFDAKTKVQKLTNNKTVNEYRPRKKFFLLHMKNFDY